MKKDERNNLINKWYRISDEMKKHKHNRAELCKKMIEVDRLLRGYRMTK